MKLEHIRAEITQLERLRTHCKNNDYHISVIDTINLKIDNLKKQIEENPAIIFKRTMVYEISFELKVESSDTNYNFVNTGDLFRDEIHDLIVDSLFDMVSNEDDCDPLGVDVDVRLR